MLHEHVGYVNSAAFEHMLVGILASSQQTELLERMDLHPDAQLENPLSNAASRHTNSSSVEEKYRRTCSFDSCIHWKREPIPLKIALCPEHVCMSFYYAGAAVVPDVATHVALCFSLQSQPFDFSSSKLLKRSLPVQYSIVRLGINCLLICATLMTVSPVFVVSVIAVRVAILQNNRTIRTTIVLVASRRVRHTRTGLAPLFLQGSLIRDATIW